MSATEYRYWAGDGSQHLYGKTELTGTYRETVRPRCSRANLQHRIVELSAAPTPLAPVCPGCATWQRQNEGAS